MDRFFDAVPEAGIVRTFHYDPVEERFWIATEQNVEDLVEQNKAISNEITSLDRHGEMRRVASIPLNVYMELREKGIVQDQKAFKRWLNDPDNRFFRTSPGKV